MRARSPAARSPASRRPPTLPYDTLIVAGGSRYSYFGHDDWSPYAAEVKSLESALMVRGHILAAFEAAEDEPDPDRRGRLAHVRRGRAAARPGSRWPGQIGELARDTLRSDFRTIDTRAGRILLVETADRLLTSFPPSLSAKAKRSLERLGVTPMLNTTVVERRGRRGHRGGARRRIRSASRPARSSGPPA